MNKEHIGLAFNIISMNMHTYCENSLFKSEGIKIYDELRYEYRGEIIPCPLSGPLICRFYNGSTSDVEQVYGN